MKRSLFLSLPLVLCACAVSYSESKFIETRSALKHHFAAEKIRVFYNLDGVHAISPADVNGNGIPDRAEDAAKQAWATHKILTLTFGFVDPLKSVRYEGVSFIDIHLLNKETIKYNGIAADSVFEFNRPIDKPGVKSLCFDLASTVDSTNNISASHEVFHLIQHASTYFENRWFYEGMARWSEHSLNTGGIGEVRYDPTGPWPQVEDHRKVLYGLTYDAEFYFWNPLAAKESRQRNFSINRVHRVVRTLTYSNGRRVLEDLEFTGWDLMRDILLELGKMDDVAFKQLKYKSWTETNQRSTKNDPYIYQAVMTAVKNRGHRVGELNLIDKLPDDELVIKSPMVEGLKSSAETIDLLELIDTKRDAIRGNWQKKDGRLVAPKMTGLARLVVPVDLPKQYALKIVAKPLQGSNLAIDLVYDGQPFYVGLDNNYRNRGDFLSGLGMLDGKDSFANESTLRERIFTPNGVTTVLISVHNDGVKIQSDNQTIMDWRGDFSRLTAPSWSRRSTPQLSLTTERSSYLIYKLELIPLE